jgi:hypothetical protein
MAATAETRHRRDLLVIERFVEVYCRESHRSAGGKLCAECDDVLSYARARLAKCPFDPKPKCKNCTVHCYRPEYRARMKEVMRFSGMYFVKRGRLDWLIRYFL